MNNDKFAQFMRLIKKSGNLVEGYNKCEDAIKRDKIHLLIISLEVSENTKKKFIDYCSKYHVSYLNKHSKYYLGSIVNKEEINVMGITNKSMADNLLSIEESLIKEI